MKKLEFLDEDYSELFELISDLSSFFDERISELHEVKGGMKDRHAFIFYRSILWQIRDVIKSGNIN